jgi:hypothetical protein
MMKGSIPSRGESSAPDAVDTSGVAASAALVAFNVAVYVAVQYVPEYLRLLGNGPVLIGLFGSTATLLAVCYPYLRPALDRLNVSAAPIVGTLASLGVVCWLFAPQIGSGSGIRSVMLMLVGLVLVASWQAFGVDTAAVSTFVPRRLCVRIPSLIRHDRTPQYVALLFGLPFVIGFLAIVSPALTAIQVVLGLTAAIGLTATVLFAVLDDFAAEIAADAPIDDKRIATVADDTSFRSVLDSVRSLPWPARQSLVGDTLVEFAVGMVSIFLVITVTSLLRIDVTLFGLRLGPDAFFGVCLFVEMAVALIATGPLTWLARRVGREYVVAGTLFIAALFPIALVSAPANATLVALLFAGFGCYRASLPIRRESISSVVTGDTGDNYEQYRAVQAMVRVPSAFVGGLLYAVSPTLAFGLAAIVGTVGMREFLVGTMRSDAEHTESR